MNTIPKTVYYHANCPDGLAAALVCWQAFDVHDKESARFIPVDYDDTPIFSDYFQKEVFIVDFSFDEATLRQIADDCESLVIIDHHKGAREAIMAIDNHPKVDIRFDLNYCGTALAWMYFTYYPDCPLPPVTELPPFIQYIQDRDLWTKALPETDAFNKAFCLNLGCQDWHRLNILYEEFNSEQSDFVKLNNASPPRLINRGLNIQEWYEHQLQQLLKNAGFTIFNGYYVPCCNVPGAFASDMGNLLIKEYPWVAFAMTYFQRSDGRFQVSLRSDDDRADVCEEAKHHGGGGHRNAAGCIIEFCPHLTPEPPAHIIQKRSGNE